MIDILHNILILWAWGSLVAWGHIDKDVAVGEYRAVVATIGAFYGLATYLFTSTLFSIKNSIYLITGWKYQCDICWSSADLAFLILFGFALISWIVCVCRKAKARWWGKSK